MKNVYRDCSCEGYCMRREMTPMGNATSKERRAFTMDDSVKKNNVTRKETLLSYTTPEGSSVGLNHVAASLSYIKSVKIISFTD